jgi:6-pyruvoyl-tetrahydropterin synthase related domain
MNVRSSMQMDSPIDSSRFGFLLATILVLAATTVVIAPMLLLGTVSGHDFPFHLASWMDVAKQWHQGTIYPQWAKLANWGLGEPRFVFYPPVSWMLGAALGSLLPWKAVPICFTALVLIGAGLSMFLLARESMPERQAALAAMLFTANPYHVLLIYYRGDFAELIASALFPLLPWGMMQIDRQGWRRVPIVALVLALIWLSNAPAAVIAVYSFVFLFAIAYVLRRDRRLLLYGAVATAGGFGLAAFYILPAAHQRAWVQINRVIADGLRPEQNFLFSRATSPAVNMDFNWKISCVVVFMTVLMIVAAIYAARSPAIPRFHYWLLVALGVISVFMMLPMSRPLWLIAPELHFVQFPWRFALPFAVAFSFLLGIASKPNRLSIWVAAAMLVLAGPVAKTLLAVKKPSSWKVAEITQLRQAIDAGIGYPGVPEYLPNSADSSVLSGNPISDPNPASENSDESTIRASNEDRNKFLVQATTARRIALSALDYPTSQVDLDGFRINSKSKDEYGCIVVPVPAGKHLIHISFERTWDAKLGIAISIFTGGFLSCLLLLTWPQRKFTALRQSKLEPRFSSATMPAAK